MSSSNVSISSHLTALIERDRKHLASIRAREYALGLCDRVHYDEDTNRNIGPLSYQQWYDCVSSCPCCPDAERVSIIRDRMEHIISEEETRCASCDAQISYFAYGTTEYASIGFAERPDPDVFTPQFRKASTQNETNSLFDFDV